MTRDGAVAALRAATAADHDRVDSLFGGFDLTDRASYGQFLLAQARALPAVERALAGREDLPDCPPRVPLLRDDLDVLGITWPEPLEFAVPADLASGWGALYVIEGSRLGGAMLARQVGTGLPARYLGAKHAPGAWRALLSGLAEAASDDEWTARAISSARATFALYARAA